MRSRQLVIVAAVVAICSCLSFSCGSGVIYWVTQRGTDAKPVVAAQDSKTKQGAADQPFVAAQDSKTKQGAAVQIEWTTLTEAENARWKRVINKVRKENHEGIKRRETQLAEAQQPLDPFKKFAKDVKAQRDSDIQFRKKELDTARASHLQYLAFSLNQKSWQTVSISIDRDYAKESMVFESRLPQVRKPYFGTTYLMHDEQTARQQVKLLAEMPDVRYVAVVDLYSGDSPTIAFWAHDDGSGVRIGNAMPFPELTDSLKTFIRELQVSAE